MVLTLNLCVLHGKNLAPRTPAGTCNAYLKIKFRGATYETQIIKDDLHPRWDEIIEIGEYGAKDIIEVTCWHKEDSWFSWGDNFLGQFIIDLHPIYKIGEIRDTFKLESRGKRSDNPVEGSIVVKLSVQDEEAETLAAKKKFLSRWFLNGRPDQSELIEAGVLPKTPRGSTMLIYGSPLDIVMKQQIKELGEASCYKIPRFIAQILEALREDELTWTEPGLFRQAGSSKRVNELRKNIEKGIPVDFKAEVRDVNGDLLKQYIRELPEPLLSSTVSPEWKALVCSPEEEHVERIRKLIKDIPCLHARNLTKEILKFCSELSKTTTTCMTPENLGTLWSANMFALELTQDKLTLNVPMKAVAMLIVNFDDVFKEESEGSSILSPRDNSSSSSLVTEKKPSPTEKPNCRPPISYRKDKPPLRDLPLRPTKEIKDNLDVTKHKIDPTAIQRRSMDVTSQRPPINPKSHHSLETIPISSSPPSSKVQNIRPVRPLKPPLSPRKHETSSPRKHETSSPRKHESPSPRRYETSSLRKHESPSPRKHESPSPRKYETSSLRKHESPSSRGALAGDLFIRSTGSLPTTQQNGKPISMWNAHQSGTLSSSSSSSSSTRVRPALPSTRGRPTSPSSLSSSTRERRPPRKAPPTIPPKPTQRTTKETQALLKERLTKSLKLPPHYSTIAEDQVERENEIKKTTQVVVATNPPKKSGWLGSLLKSDLSVTAVGELDENNPGGKESGSRRIKQTAAAQPEEQRTMHSIKSFFTRAEE